jgi:hypothetical protein
MVSCEARGERGPEAYPQQRTECDTIPANIDKHRPSFSLCGRSNWLSN